MLGLPYFGPTHGNGLHGFFSWSLVGYQERPTKKRVPQQKRALSGESCALRLPDGSLEGPSHFATSASEILEGLGGLWGTQGFLRPSPSYDCNWQVG